MKAQIQALTQAYKALRQRDKTQGELIAVRSELNRLEDRLAAELVKVRETKGNLTAQIEALYS